MIVLGVDPALSKTGWAIVQWNGKRKVKLLASGLIKTKPKEEIPDRLLAIFEQFSTAACEHWNVDVCAIENTIFVKAGADAAIKLGAARGVIYLCAAIFGLPVFQYHPPTIKKEVAGHGRAGKDDVQDAVRKTLKLTSTQQEDEADATATALCYLVKEHGYILDS